MNQNNQGHSEKRDYIRMKIDTPQEITLSGSGKSYSGICRELSGGGLLVEINDSPQLNDELEIHIASNHGHTPELRAKTQVVRVEPMAEGFSVGLKMIEVLRD